MNLAIAQHGLTPVVDSTFPLARVKDAFVRMERAEHFGKICVVQ
jgi:NADPH:quinone reductase-like Zn-dependent oxidoreductase